jgi:hypothetical protein
MDELRVRVLVGLGDVGRQVVRRHGCGPRASVSAVVLEVGGLFRVSIGPPVGMGSVRRFGWHVLFSKVTASFSQDRRQFAN